jgi:hypothetical protein
MDTLPTQSGDPDEWATEALQEIESNFPPKKFSLEDYRSHLQALETEVQQRIEQLCEEIGD